MISLVFASYAVMRHVSSIGSDCANNIPTIGIALTYGNPQKYMEFHVGSDNLFDAYIFV